jgi:hypothetical protein
MNTDLGPSPAGLPALCQPEKREVDPTFLSVVTSRPSRAPDMQASEVTAVGYRAGPSGRRVSVPKLWSSGQTPRLAELSESDRIPALAAASSYCAYSANNAGSGRLSGEGKMWVIVGEAASAEPSPAPSRTASAASSTADTIFTCRPARDAVPPLPAEGAALQA